MSSAPTPAEIAHDARWLTQALDPATGIVRLVAMTADEYRAAAFLDDRLLQQTADARAVPWSQIFAAAALVRGDDARWIFHIGHVGSTLVARLLGELPTVLAVREPRLLRDLCSVDGPSRADYFPATRALFSRSFGAGQAAVVKATSFVSEIAPDLVGPAGRAAFLAAAPRNYIATILAGENNIRELHALAPVRAQRMAERVRGLGSPTNAAELAAAAWACEMTALEAAAEALPDANIVWVDFDRLLDDVGGHLRQISEGLTLDAADQDLAALAQSPLLKQYSKAPEYEYSTRLRRDLIAEAAAHFANDIDGALAMLDRASEKSPLLARALRR
ncbi:MAG: hypothetical protein H0W71_02010 [Sphingomonas sp.]|nr:hypothetical protein [Sphingomonas sp.]